METPPLEQAEGLATERVSTSLRPNPPVAILAIVLGLFIPVAAVFAAAPLLEPEDRGSDCVQHHGTVDVGTPWGSPSYCTSRDGRLICYGREVCDYFNEQEGFYPDDIIIVG